MGFVSLFLNKSESLPARARSVLFLLRSDLPQNCPLSVESVPGVVGQGRQGFPESSALVNHVGGSSPGAQ